MRHGNRHNTIIIWFGLNRRQLTRDCLINDHRTLDPAAHPLTLNTRLHAQAGERDRLPPNRGNVGWNGKKYRQTLIERLFFREPDFALP